MELREKKERSKNENKKIDFSIERRLEKLVFLSFSFFIYFIFKKEELYHGRKT